MKYCKAKKFSSRMSHTGMGKAMGEKGTRGSVGKSAGELKMGNMTRPLKAAKYPHAQSSDGNGGQ
jgi:hypothetical protein